MEEVETNAQLSVLLFRSVRGPGMIKDQRTRRTELEAKRISRQTLNRLGPPGTAVNHGELR